MIKIAINLTLIFSLIVLITIMSFPIPYEIKNQYALEHNYILIRIPYLHYNNLCLKDLLLESDYIIKKE